jgi:transcription antitermination factor NusG
VNSQMRAEETSWKQDCTSPKVMDRGEFGRLPAEERGVAIIAQGESEHDDEGDQKWFALVVKSRHEKAVAGLLKEKGFDSWVPTEKKTHRYQSAIKTSDIPLFPGYVFCRFDGTIRLPVLSTPGVVHVVSAGSHLLPVDDIEITSLRTAVERNAPLCPSVFLEGGSRVRIAEGPFEGVTGVVVKSCRPFRLMLSVTLLQRAVLLEIDADNVIVDRV